jgi:hypothetical protein
LARTPSLLSWGSLKIVVSFKLLVFGTRRYLCLTQILMGGNKARSATWGARTLDAFRYIPG